METSDQRLRQAISLIIEAGYQLDINALNFLKSLTQNSEMDETVNKTLEELASLPEHPLFLTKESLEATRLNIQKKADLKSNQTS